ncbi:platelet-activating factor acetylhydrolase [Tachysurus ichikawai]
MGNSVGQNSLGIPRGKGPHQVGCTDLMVGHTVQGTFFRLYYPCQAQDGSVEPNWIPCREYFAGLADFMKMSRALGDRIFNYLFGSYKIPTAWNAPFKTDGKYPVIIFSHGLGAFRDESASATFYYKEKSEVNQSHQTQREAFQPVSGNLVEEWMYYRRLKTGESEFLLRNNQVKQRADECIRALDLLININLGTSVENILRSDFDWSKLKNCMDLCKIAVMGHSFGGATVIECLCKEVKFSCGIALDTWMFPLDEEIFPSVKQPILFINSEKFQWAGNIMLMKKLDSPVIPRKMITIKGAVHQSFPDFTFLTGNCIGKLLKLKGEINPNIAMDLCNRASLAFLQRHLSLERDFNQWDHLIDGKDDHLIPGTNITLLQSSI